MADIVPEIISDIQSDIDSGYYDPDNFDLYEAIWETLDNKLIYTHNIIEYWDNTPGGASEEITRLMVEEITEYVNESISDADFNFPNDFTANRRAMRGSPVNRRRMAHSRSRAANRAVARSKTAETYGGWSNSETAKVVGLQNNLDVIFDVTDIASMGTPDDLADYYWTNFGNLGIDLNKVNWKEIWENLRVIGL